MISTLLVVSALHEADHSISARQELGTIIGSRQWEDTAEFVLQRVGGSLWTVEGFQMYPRKNNPHVMRKRSPGSLIGKRVKILICANDMLEHTEQVGTVIGPTRNDGRVRVFLDPGICQAEEVEIMTA